VSSSTVEAVGRPRLSDAGLRRLAWGLMLFMIAGAVTGLLLDRVSGASTDGTFAVGLLIFPIMGFLVVLRRPRTTLGWLMIVMGILVGLPLESYGAYALTVEGGAPLGTVALALSGPTWIPFIAGSGYLLLLFPDGHLPSPRWRWFAWGCGVGLAVLALLIVFGPGTFEDAGFPDVRNPLGIDALEPITSVGYALAVFAPIVVLGGALGVVLRVRRATDDVVRHQLRWLAYAAALIAVLFVPGFVFSESGWALWLQTASVLSFALIPISIGIAIMRYRLYDIDIVIRKTLAFGLLAAFIALVYAGVVVGVGAFVGSRAGGVLSAAAAAIVAVAFQPVARRASRLADRVVYGERATPYEVLAQFVDQLSETYSTEDVLPRTARVLAEGVGAERARVWLVVGEDLRQVAVWPTDAASGAPDDFTAEVRHQGDRLGALSVAMPANDPMNPAKESLVQDLAAQAGLVLRNVRLTELLRARLADLQAAQKRLVTAQDQERRRLERNIHDGAQQQLVAFTVKLRLAEGLIARDPAKATDMLSQLRDDTQTALEDLRDLARGIYPPLLADKGLAAALEAQARKSPVPVAVEWDGLGRFPQEVEAAVYFSCLEALQNVAKYAGASRATVSLRHLDGSLTFSVSDDGDGFDPGETGYGTGLQGIADRLGALDGDLEVRSHPGTGTTVTGRVPVEGPTVEPPAASRTVRS